MRRYLFVWPGIRGYRDKWRSRCTSFSGNIQFKTPVPRPPIPRPPSTIRSLGQTEPFNPSADPGTITGAASAPAARAVRFRNWRRSRPARVTAPGLLVSGEKFVCGIRGESTRGFTKFGEKSKIGTRISCTLLQRLYQQAIKWRKIFRNAFVLRKRSEDLVSACPCHLLCPRTGSLRKVARPCCTLVGRVGCSFQIVERG